MILIFSEKSDQSTRDVENWLNYYSQPFIRMDDDHIHSYKFSFDLLNKYSTFWIDDKMYSSSNIKVVWYRRANFTTFTKAIDTIDQSLKPIFEQTIQEINTCRFLLYQSLSHAHWLNSPYTTNITKPIVSSIANKCGLNIPFTLITADVSKVDNLLDTNKKYVIKPIREVTKLFHKSYLYQQYTKEFSFDEIKLLYSKNTIPILIQEKINKKLELRIFYLDGEYYSMAIFSQENEQTMLDFRRYSETSPNHFVPFNLNGEIKEKLHILMTNLNLNSGSIDMIVSPNDVYYFLEVNPIGQFGMVSYPCNYHLEHKIAQYLIKHNNE